MTDRLSSRVLRCALAGAIAILLACPVCAGSIGCLSAEHFVATSEIQKEKPDELNKEAVRLVESGSLAKALELFEQAVELYRQAGDAGGQAKAVTNIGYVYFAKKEWVKARESYTQALDSFRLKNDRANEAELLVRIAFVFDKEEDRKTAVRFYEQALPLLEAEGNLTRAGSVILAAGSDLLKLGENQAVLDLLLPKLSLWRTTRNRTGEAQALEFVGMAYGEMVSDREALSYYEQSLAAWLEVGNQSRQAGLHGLMAGIELDRGNHEEALLHYTKSISILREIKDTNNEARVLVFMGDLYAFSGDSQRGLGYYKQALSLWKTLDDPSGTANTLHALGLAYSLRGEYSLGLSYYDKSLALWRAIRRDQEEARTLSMMGTVSEWARDYQKAAEYFNQSLAVSQRIKDPAGEADVLGKLGQTYATMILLHIPFSYPAEVQTYLDQSLQRIWRIGDPRIKALLLGRVALICTISEDPKRAVEYCEQALRLSEDSGYREGAAIALHNAGLASEMHNNPQKALDYYQRSIKLRETMRASAHLEDIKFALSGSSADSYQHAAVLLMKTGDPARAFDLTERARARSLLDQLANFRPRPKQKASAGLFKEEQSLELDLASIERRLALESAKTGPSLDRAAIASLQDQLAAKRSQYEDLLTRLKLADPEYASLRTVSPLTLRDLQRRIGKGVTLISYFVTDQQTLAFVITRDSFNSVVLRVAEAKLADSIGWFRAFPRDGAGLESLKRLHEQLIAPLRQHLKTIAVVIVPHGVLNYLPFAPLTDGRHCFGDEHVISYLPSASVLPLIQRRKPLVGRPLLAVGQSHADGLRDLQHADEEVRAIGALFHTKPPGEHNLSKAAFLREAGDYRVLHIAAHGQVDPVSPMFSRIWLAPGDQSGALTVHEVYDLNLSKTDLVVLSACETQLGALSQGDDIVGLNRAFLYAGASSIVASLWTVDDESTGVLMRSFYKHLRRGIGKAQALQGAQSETRREYPHPYYWAGFVLTGDRARCGPRPGRGETRPRQAHSHVKHRGADQEATKHDSQQ